MHEITRIVSDRSSRTSQDESKQSMIKLNTEESMSDSLIDGGADVNIKNVVGTVARTDKQKLAGLVFRATRGNALCTFYDFEQETESWEGIEELKEKQEERSIFVIVYEKGPYINKRI